MKSITIAGNIGKDAETRTTRDGDKVTSWSVAVEDRSSREKGTIWFDVSLWGARGEALCDYLTKGSKVVVSGDLGKREHDGKTYLTVKAYDVSLTGGGQSSGDKGEVSRRTFAPIPASARDMDDEIPF